MAQFGRMLQICRATGAWRTSAIESFSSTVLTTTSCNLGCGYCFQNTGLDPTGGSNPPRIEAWRLNSHTTEQIIAFAAKQMALSGLDKLSLVLFGGEPLLNPRACLEILRRSKSIGLQYATVTTNAVLLTRQLAKDLASAGLCHAQVTFDGSREDHDKIRVKKSGKATFDTILNNVAEATELTELDWTLRVNVSHINAARIEEIFHQLDGRVYETLHSRICLGGRRRIRV